MTAGNRKIARDSGAVEIIVKAINMHSNNTNLCLFGCVALGCLVYDKCKQQ